MFVNEAIAEYVEKLASPAPTPGGGSALAVVAANACALAEMACNVTSAKFAKKNVALPQAEECAKQLAALRLRASELADRDAEAFDGIIAAMRLPKTTEEEKAKRHVALQAAYVHGAEVPLELMQSCATAAELATTAAKLADEFVRSDAEIGLALLRCVIKCSLHHVLVNADVIDNADVRASFTERAASLAEKYGQ